MLYIHMSTMSTYAFITVYIYIYDYICLYSCIYIYTYIYVYISHILGFQGFRQQWVFDAAKKPVESCQEPLGN